jgi:hypothetical protein
MMRRSAALVAATIIAVTVPTACTSLSEAEKRWCAANDQAVYQVAQNLKIEDLERPASSAQDSERSNYILELEQRYPQYYKRACKDAYERR